MSVVTDRRSLHRRGAACCLAAISLGLVLPVWAQGERARGQELPARSLPRLDVAVVQNACDVSALQSKIGSWFIGSSTRTSTHSEPTLDANSVLAPSPVEGVRLWLVASSPTAVWLYFAVQPQPGVVPRYLVRDVALDHGFDELGMEQLAQVIFLSSLALWSGQLQSPKSQLEHRLSVAAPTARARAGTPRLSVASADSALLTEPGAHEQRLNTAAWTLHAEFGYGFRVQGREGISQGPLGALRLLRAADSLDFGGRLVAQLLLPRNFQDEPVVLDLRGYSLHLAAWLSPRSANGLSVTAELGPGMDVIRYAVNSSTDPSVQPAPAQWEIRPIAWLAGGIEGTASRVRVGMQVSVAFQLLRTHYDIVDGNQHTMLLTPWMVQPGFAAHVAF